MISQAIETFFFLTFQIEGKAGAVAGEGVLQNFFNSLLNRRTGSPIAGSLASVRPPGGKFLSLILVLPGIGKNSLCAKLNNKTLPVSCIRNLKVVDDVKLFSLKNKNRGYYIKEGFFFLVI